MGDTVMEEEVEVDEKKRRKKVLEEVLDDWLEASQKVELPF